MLAKLRRKAALELTLPKYNSVSLGVNTEDWVLAWSVVAQIFVSAPILCVRRMD